MDQAILAVRWRGGAGEGVRALACVVVTVTSGSSSPGLQEENRVVVIRFGHDYDEQCMQMDEVTGVGGVEHSACAAATPSSTCNSSAVLQAHSSPTYLSTQILASTAEKMKNFAVIYLVDISEVPDFNAMYELYDPCTVMFFFRNKVR